MKSEEVFAMGLGLQSPWEVKSVSFEDSSEGKDLHIYIDFQRGSRFSNDVGEEVSAYDTEDKMWRHLNFFEHKCYLHCRVPRIPMSDGKVRLVEVPWARQGSGFTLLFEAYTLKLIESEMPVSSVSKHTHVTAPRIWRVFHYWVSKARENLDLSGVRRIGVDETSSQKGHNYITNFVDLDTRQLIFCTSGKGEDTFDAFVKELESRGGHRQNIEIVSMDMSPSFISGYYNHFSHASLVFDRFHIIKMLNEALDNTRKGEQADKKLLKGHRFTLLHKRANLSEKRQMELETLLLTYPTIGEAYKYKEGFFDAFTFDNAEDAIEYLRQWCEAVERTSLIFMKKFVNTLKAHWSGIITNFTNPNVNNGILEGINQKIQLAKRRARGFALISNFIDMAYFVSGKLKFDYPCFSL
ncbi:MAG: ISL3 family transposase [Bacteroidaceae bacterium]